MITASPGVWPRLMLLLSSFCHLRSIRSDNDRACKNSGSGRSLMAEWFLRGLLPARFQHEKVIAMIGKHWAMVMVLGLVTGCANQQQQPAPPSAKHATEEAEEKNEVKMSINDVPA